MVSPPRRLVLLGHPVSHSLSPIIQNAALQAAGIPLRYEAVDVLPLALSTTLRDLAERHGAGNVTIPHKMEVLRSCAQLTGVAQRAGAVNTFWTEGGRLCGDNTDVAGFEAAVTALGARRDGAVVVVLGAGGAAAAVCTAVGGWPGATLRIVGRSTQRCQALAARFPAVAVAAESLREALAGASLVVNATPVGMRDDDLPMAVAAVPRDADVMDLVYRAGETPWVHAARTLGLRAIDGSEMLLQQGAASFRRWFGVDPHLPAMRSALNGAVEHR